MLTTTHAAATVLRGTPGGSRLSGRLPLWRGAVAVGAIAVAFHYSLRTLVSTLDLDTPLAYLGLVPLVALGVGVLATRRENTDPDIEDRQFDFIIGIPLVAGALLLSVVLPERLSTQYWVWRLDLLVLPIFAAGVVALIFGVRRVWHTKAALFLLCLAWPVPYLHVLDAALGAATSLTAAAVRGVVTLTGLVRVAPGDGAIFTIDGPDGPFALSVASACAGLNSLVGFLVVGAGALALVDGRRRSKALWLAAGAAVVWAFNVVRILVILLAGRVWGERAALDVFHPYLGLVTFTAGVALMWIAIPRFGVAARQFARRDTEESRERAPRLRVAVALVVLFAGLAALSNARLQQFDPLADELGRPRLVGFTQSQPAPSGWDALPYAQYTHARPYFGGDSSWLRFLYQADAVPGSASTPAPVLVDVIATPERRRLAAYGVEQCYDFHGYEVSSRTDVALPGGVKGRELTYVEPRGDRVWTTLHWEWPVATPDGLRYERVVLMLIDAGRMSLAQIGGSTAQVEIPGPHDRAELVRYLRTFAETMIAAQRSTVRTFV